MMGVDCLPSREDFGCLALHRHIQSGVATPMIENASYYAQEAGFGDCCGLS